MMQALSKKKTLQDEQAEVSNDINIAAKKKAFASPATPTANNVPKPRAPTLAGGQSRAPTLGGGQPGQQTSQGNTGPQRMGSAPTNMSGGPQAFGSGSMSGSVTATGAGQSGPRYLNDADAAQAAKGKMLSSNASIDGMVTEAPTAQRFLTDELAEEAARIAEEKAEEDARQAMMNSTATAAGSIADQEPIQEGPNYLNDAIANEAAANAANNLLDDDWNQYMNPELYAALMELMGGPRDLTDETATLQEQMDRQLGQALADQRSIGASGGLGLTGAQAALEGDTRSRAALDQSSAIFGLEQQARDEWLDRLGLAGSMFDPESERIFDEEQFGLDRVREDEMLTLLRNILGVDGQGSPVEPSAEQPSSPPPQEDPDSLGGQIETSQANSNKAAAETAGMTQEEFDQWGADLYQRMIDGEISVFEYMRMYQGGSEGFYNSQAQTPWSN